MVGQTCSTGGPMKGADREFPATLYAFLLSSFVGTR